MVTHAASGNSSGEATTPLGSIFHEATRHQSATGVVPSGKRPLGDIREDQEAAHSGHSATLR